MSSNPDSAELAAMWDTNAAFWDEHVGPKGNDFHRLLVAPAQMRLLALEPGTRVLELACGNGQFSREMALAGAVVTASDFSRVFVERARSHASGEGLHIDYRVCDVTDETQILALGDRGSFDAAICTMAIHDIADVGPMSTGLHEMVRPGGCFVFSVMHPAFNATNPVFVAETVDEDGDVTTRYALKISGYENRPPERGVGIIGQPQAHWYFPRTLAELLEPFLRAGWVLDGLEEPAYPAGMGKPERPFSWTNYPGIPPVLVVRFRRLPNLSG